MALRYKLMHMFGNDIHVGTKQECEIILKSFITYGISDHKFDIVEFETESFLDSNLREKLDDKVYSILKYSVYSDGVEGDMIYNGLTIVGLNEMSDEELMEDIESYLDEDDSLVIEAKAQQAIYNTLKAKE